MAGRVRLPVGLGLDAERRRFALLSALSLVAFLAWLWATWRWFDVDEFVNLQQAIRAGRGLELYLETPASHPPLYPRAWLGASLALPGSALLDARLTSTVATWATGGIAAGLYWRGDPARARTFLVLWSLGGFVALVGTRASNEVPTALLLTAGLALMERGRPWAAGAAVALAGLTRYSAVFFAPFVLAYERDQVARALAGGLAVAAGTLTVLAWGRPGILQAMYEETLAFHAARASHAWYQRVAVVAGFSGLPLAGWLAWRRPGALRPRSRAARAAALAAFGSLAMVALPVVHPHYLFPLAPAAVALFAEGVHRARETGTRRALLAAALVLLAAQAGGYALIAQGGDLDRRDEAGRWIRRHAPADEPVLADVPLHPVREDRTNAGGYYWALRDRVNRSTWSGWLERASVVVVSETFGPDGHAYPGGLTDELADRPCRAFEAEWVVWTGEDGPPAGFGACPGAPWTG